MIRMCNLFVLSVLVLPLFFQELEKYTFKLTQSTSSFDFWTAPPTTKVFKETEVPDTENGDIIKVYSAKNEFEPFQVIVIPSSSQSLAFEAPVFSNSLIEVEVYQVKYIHISQPTDHLGHVGDWPDILWPIENICNVDVVAGENTAFWVNIHVPYEGVDSGDYPSEVKLGGVSIPVNLHVFNFQIPLELHIKSQMNFGFKIVLEKYGVIPDMGYDEEYWEYVDGLKKFFMNHRLTPASSLWPGGINLNEYDCDTHTVNDPHGIWGFEDLAQQGLIDGIDGVKFPSAIAVGCVGHGSQDPRPSDICGVSRTAGDFLSTASTPYNSEYFTWLKAFESYIEDWDLLDQLYLYPFDEPNLESDYDGVAWLSSIVQKQSPKLQFFVTEPPRKEIYDHPDFPGSKINIWCPVLYQLDPVAMFDRKGVHDETIWMYYLYGDRPPLFAPMTIDHPGIEGKLTGFLLWRYRIEGILYYSFNGAWDDTNPYTDPMYPSQYKRNGEQSMIYPPSPDNQPIPYGANNHRFVPSIRFELMRDTLEDYEYLYVLNDNKAPTVAAQNTKADLLAKRIILGIAAANRDENLMYNLRRLIGEYNGGEIRTIPDILWENPHPRALETEPGNYYINFQDPADEPLDDPLIVDDHEWMKIGWNDYDHSVGYGWMGLTDARMYSSFISSGESSVLQRSTVYDNNGRSQTFFFDLPNGGYDVEVSVGWQGREYEYNRVFVQGVPFVDMENNNEGFIVRKKEIFVSSRLLAMEMGGYPSSGQFSMVNYIKIEANGKSINEIDDTICPDGISNCKAPSSSGVAGGGGTVAAILITLAVVGVVILVLGLVVAVIVVIVVIKRKRM